MLPHNVLVSVVYLITIGTCRPASVVECPVTSTHICACVPEIIDCINHGISKVPTFSNPSTTFHQLLLQRNNISRIESDSFVTLHDVTDIDLSYNQISFIDEQAFSAISGKLKILNLAHNKLLTLPNALATLNILQELDVTWNPIPGTVNIPHRPAHSGLNDLIMRNLGDTIEVFKFGSTDMKSWPDSVSHLNRLNELRVVGLDMFYWPPDSFHGFEQTLNRLFIQNLSIGSLPVGLDSLSHVEELHLDFLGGTFGDGSLFVPPFKTIANTLKVLSLTYDHLTYFPTAIQNLTSLTSLALDGNQLSFVSDEAIQLLANSNITRLSLKDCGLKRVPGALSDLHTLQELDLSRNLIRTLESTDLHDLSSLKRLTLNHNPLQYLSDNSLCGLQNLEHFELVNTSITEMSTSFKFLSHLRTMDLSQSKIDCTCKLTWVKYWMTFCMRIIQQPHIMGDCETIDMPITDYINSRVINCRGYNLDYLDFTCEGCARR